MFYGGNLFGTPFQQGGGGFGSGSGGFGGGGFGGSSPSIPPMDFSWLPMYNQMNPFASYGLGAGRGPWSMYPSDAAPMPQVQQTLWDPWQSRAQQFNQGTGWLYDSLRENPFGPTPSALQQFNPFSQFNIMRNVYQGWGDTGRLEPYWQPSWNPIQTYRPFGGYF